jgi:hypothetical protein
MCKDSSMTRSTVRRGKSHAKLLGHLFKHHPRTAAGDDSSRRPSRAAGRAKSVAHTRAPTFPRPRASASSQSRSGRDVAVGLPVICDDLSIARPSGRNSARPLCGVSSDGIEGHSPDDGDLVSVACHAANRDHQHHGRWMRPMAMTCLPAGERLDAPGSCAGDSPSTWRL